MKPRVDLRQAGEGGQNIFAMQYMTPDQRLRNWKHGPALVARLVMRGDVSRPQAEALL
jgi:hypothetical protein